MDQNFIALEDVAKRLNLHINTLYNAVRAGELEAYKIGRKYRATPEAVEKYIQNKRVVAK